MQHGTGTLIGQDNTPLFTQNWLPDHPPRAVVLIAHGLSEHSGRYAHVASYLVQRGYAVYALDHRGHGQSGGPRLVAERFEDYVDDLRTYFEQVRAAQPGLPVFLYGHSMGSLISLLFASRHQDDLAGLITSGTALRLMGTNGATIPVVKGLGRLAPHAPLIPLDPRGVSRDPAVVQRYRDDPLVYHGWIPVKMAAELQRAAEACIRSLPSLHIPYLALHGSADPICRPVGAAIIREQSGAPDTTVKVYQGLRHEVHNEPEQGQVLNDIAEWLDAHMPGAQPPSTTRKKTRC
jgi:alpha-beta hydrolase superfamily lysophospholipase